ncbi:MAG: integrase core domain-containing protein [Phormidesmis sp.]
MLLRRLATLCLRPFVAVLQFMLRPLIAFTDRAAPNNDSLLLASAADLARSRTELLLENAMLRQQLIVLQRQVKRPLLNNKERFLLALLASKLSTWKNTLLIVKPDTLLRWHRAGFRLFWKQKSRSSNNRSNPKLAAETIELIKQIAKDNRLWGAERIRGELLKLDICVAKRTIQKYMRTVRAGEPTGGLKTQNWSNFLHNHSASVWACDFLQVYDLFFRPLFIFLVIEHGTRRVVHFRVTRNPTDAWAAQQLREATPYGQQPKYLIRDNDRKFGAAFRRVAAVSGIKQLRIAYKAPKMNAVCERLLGSVRRECLDHIIILSEAQLHQVLKEYIQYYNASRPHQGIGQATPQSSRQRETEPTATAALEPGSRIVAFPVLGGLHHDYRKAA